MSTVQDTLAMQIDNSVQQLQAENDALREKMSILESKVISNTERMFDQKQMLQAAQMLTESDAMRGRNGEIGKSLNAVNVEMNSLGSKLSQQEKTRAYVDNLMARLLDSIMILLISDPSDDDPNAEGLVDLKNEGKVKIQMEEDLKKSNKRLQAQNGLINMHMSLMAEFDKAKKRIDDIDTIKMLEHMARSYQNFYNVLRNKNSALGSVQAQLSGSSDVGRQLDGLRSQTEMIMDIVDSIFMDGGIAVEALAKKVESNKHQIQQKNIQIRQVDYRLRSIGEKLEEVLEKQALINRANKEKELRAKMLTRKLQAMEYGKKSLPWIGEILITGGFGPNQQGKYSPTQKTFVMSPDFKTVKSFDSMKIPFAGHCSVKYEDSIYVLGGAKQKALRLNGTTAEWEEIEDMKYNHDYGAACSVFQDRLWICGGYSKRAEDVCESFAPRDGWRQEANLASPQYSTYGVSDEFNFYAIGGKDHKGNEKSPVQHFDAAVGAWRMIDPLPIKGIKDTSAIIFDGNVFVIGGYQNESRVFKLTNKKKWVEFAKISTGRIRPSLQLVNDKIWVFGGSVCKNSKAGCKVVVDVVDPRSGETWTENIKNLEEVHFASSVTI